MKKVILMLVLFAMVLSTLQIAYADTSELKLNDIEKHWAKDNIEKLISMGIVNGYDDATFRPDNTLKFEEFIKMLITATEKEKTEVIQGEKWYQNYVDVALKNNYITNDMTVLIGADIDRKTMSEIIYNAIIFSNEGMIKLNEKELAFIADKFSDLNIADKKTLHIAAMGIINGYPDKTFKPDNSLKRCEATTVILRILDASIRTPIEIVLPKELSDFPTPDFEYLKQYPTVDGKTVAESFEATQKFNPYLSMQKALDDYTNFMEMLINRDYRTISDKKLTFNYQPIFAEEKFDRAMSYKDWLLYYTNGEKEYCGMEYHGLRSYFKNDPQIYNSNEINDWFENFQDKFIQDTIENGVVVEGKFYTEDELFLSLDGGVAVRGILRFKFESHNNPSNIKEELDLVQRKSREYYQRISKSDGVNYDYGIYMNLDLIPDIEVGQWYEMAIDISVKTKSSVHGIEEILGMDNEKFTSEKAHYNYNHLYPIYLKKLN